jgi:hypothetical protein
MDINQPTTAKGLSELTEEEFQQLSVDAGGSGKRWAGCNYAHSLRIAQRAYAKGADVELEACCAWLDGTVVVSPSTQAKRLRATRRPKPPSLRAQALAILDDCNLDAAHENTLRRALEALPE